MNDSNLLLILLIIILIISISPAFYLFYKLCKELEEVRIE